MLTVVGDIHMFCIVLLQSRDSFLLPSSRLNETRTNLILKSSFSVLLVLSLLLRNQLDRVNDAPVVRSVIEGRGGSQGIKACRSHGL